MVGVVNAVELGKRTLHLWHAAAKRGPNEGLLVMWALLNLAVVLGLLASEWAREVCPIRKNGPVVVSSVLALRPVSYVGDLARFYDAAWLNAARSRLYDYSGPWQAGGGVI